MVIAHAFLPRQNYSMDAAKAPGREGDAMRRLPFAD
jgi:hypothetical protein